MKSPLASYDKARWVLLVMIIMTAVNMVLDVVGSDSFYVDSLMLPYSFFWTSIGGSIFGVLLLGLYLVCYILSKKKGAWMVVGLVLFIVDIVWLLFSMLVSIPNYGVGSALYIYGLSFIIHIVVLVFLILGVKNRKTATAPAQPMPVMQNPGYQAPMNGDPMNGAPMNGTPMNQPPVYTIYNTPAAPEVPGAQDAPTIQETPFNVQTPTIEETPFNAEAPAAGEAPYQAENSAQQNQEF